MIAEELMHGPSARRRARRIDEETVLIPRAAAEGVWEEAQAWLHQALPRRWVRELVAHANTVYAHNAGFRRKISGQGDAGRDWLWTFMRHWLAAIMRQRRPQLFARLPAEFCIGRDLPDRRHGRAN